MDIANKLSLYIEKQPLEGASEKQEQTNPTDSSAFVPEAPRPT